MMIVREVTHVSLDSFRERTKGKKLVLLYPWTNYRNVFLNYYLQTNGQDLLYYRITAEQNTLHLWLQGVVSEFGSTIKGFGKNLDTALEGIDPKRLGQALAEDLKAHSKKSPLIFYIDEFDRIPFDDAMSTFFTELIGSLPANVQIALSSRLLTHQPWYSFVEQGDALVLGTERRKDDLIFRVEESVKPQLEVYALGRGHVLVNGVPITNWDGALPRNLFFYFMDNPLVTRDEIFSTFWPELPVKDATNVFHVTKRKISERIGMKVDDPGSYELTQYGSGFYTPSEKLVRHYDVNDFETAVERALLTMDDREEVMLLSRAIDLYQGPFLQGLEMPWMVERRARLRTLYGQALISIGRIAKRRDEQEKALGLFLRALKEIPDREDIHREVMALYLQIGMVEDARAHYQRLVKHLKDTLNIEPSLETRNLYSLIEQRL
ncbi:MAG: bacterial transcriptional activator domain-containing protein [Anaerolineae bacterium]|nr:bacterial transcriptional activator domain-containing protein [Anaerolineae bacterium]